MQHTLDVGIDIQGELISEHYIKDRLKKSKEFEEMSEEAQKKFSNIKDLYDSVKDVIEDYDESDLKEEFIKPVLSELGFGKEYRHVEAPFLSHKGVEERPDFALFNDEEDKREAIKNKKNSDKYFDLTTGLIEVKKVNKDLDKGRKRNPAVQIKRYLRMTKVRWGILTTGKKWRLYCGETGYSSNVYLEFDLFSILEHNKKMVFNYFYTFFSYASFKKEKGSSFLDEIFEENVKFAREVEDDLEKNVYEALKVLAEGFLHYDQNDLEKEDLTEIHENSLILLYRMLFLFYAESKGLIEFGEHYKKYSILDIREDIKEDIESNQKYAPFDNSYWDKIKTTFRIINLGSEKVIGEEGILPYNGRLFDSEKHPFLEENKIGNNHLMETIDLLARRKSKEGWDWVDYETLQIRHLGSIYERLLEYKLKVAEEDLALDDDEKYVEAEEGDEVVVPKENIYLRTDKGERKATGSYYTPDYIVQYIVKNTVGDLIDERINEAEEKGESRFEAILNLNILDPAMGSGHFLVGTVEYMAEELADALSRDIEDGVWDGNEIDQEDAKREIVRRCIYGVDKNPLAVELAKLSLWLTTLSEGKPLNFLDHRLKCGNSLIGAEIDDLSYHPNIKDKDQKRIDTFNIESLAKQISKFDETKDEKLEDVKKKERWFKKLEDSKPYEKIKTLADVRTAIYFKNDGKNKNFEENYMSLANKASEGSEEVWEEWKSSRNWIKESRKLADDKKFFHWELEFSDIFFEKEGFKENPGFDAVIGNPPWAAEIENEKYIKSNFQKTKRANDTASYFLELCSQLSKNKIYGMIVKNSIVFIDPWKEVRNLLANDGIKKAMNAGIAFEDADIESIVVITNGKNNKEYDIDIANPLKRYKENKEVKNRGKALLSLIQNLETLIVNSLTKKENDILQKLSENNRRFEEIIEYVCRGEDIDDSGDSSVCYVRQGPQIDRYVVKNCKSVPKSITSEEKIKRILKPKIIGKPLRGWKPVFCVDDEGNILTGSNYSNIFIKDDSDLSLYSLSAILNSSIMAFYMVVGIYSKNTETARHLDSAYVGRVPIASVEGFDNPVNSQDLEHESGIGEDILENKIDLSNENKILDFLGREMPRLKMNKKNIKEEFYTDLRGITDEETYQSLRKGKQGRTLFRKSSFEPYVEEGSYTTHHLHEALSWNREAFKEFAKILSKNIPNFSEIMKLYDKYTEKLSELNTNIEEIDNIIDAIVFELYDLDQDEVKTVLNSLDTPKDKKENVLDRFRDIKVSNKSKEK